jgi:hypothetical protein
MPNRYPNLNTEAVSLDSSVENMTEFISVVEALKLVAPFKGKERNVLAFIANVDNAFEVTDRRNTGTLFKFILTQISGECQCTQRFRKLGRIKGILKEYLY